MCQRRAFASCNRTLFYLRLLRLLLPATLVVASHAQEPPKPAEAALTGLVTDPSGAVVPNATVVLHPVPEDSGSPERSTVTNSAGRYTLAAPDGTIGNITVDVAGFAMFLSDSIQLAAGRPRTLDIHLAIQQQQQQIDVSPDDANATDPNQNGDAIVLKGKAIDALPLDSTELQQQLQTLAGSDSPDIYVDGFSGGSIPPRDSIREIRINQNPYSAQNDTNPINGMIQIFTKPGSDKLHGNFFFYGNDSSFNSLNPFVTQEPAYYSFFSNANLSGPVTHHSSFFATSNHRTAQSNAVVNAQVLDSNLNQTSFTQAVPTPLTTNNVSGRFDTMAGKNSTMIFRYIWENTQQVNGGIGQFALASQGFNSNSTIQTLQVSNSQVLSPRIVNDTRFQYVRSRTSQTPNSLDPAVVVQGAFTGGGNNIGFYRDNQDRYELQNYVSAAEGKHYFTFGGRLRAGRDASHALANFNGEFIFSSLAAYQITQQGLHSGLTPAQIRTAGGGASQFNLTAGTPDLAVTLVDAGLFFQDDWKAKPNLTLSYGLRFESQNHINDHADWAPRIGLAWSFDPGKNKSPQYVLRSAAGIFYSRFPSSNVLQAQRQNGITQKEYVVNSPDFYPQIPDPSTLGPQAAPTIYSISPTYHSPYFLSSNVSLERRFGSLGSFTVTYLMNRGVHSMLTRNINAPLPGTYNLADPTSGVRPLGGNQNIYQYESAGVYRSNRLSANYFFRTKTAFFFYGYYLLRFDKTDASGGGFPSNQYDIGADYGRSSADTRNNLNLGVGSNLRYGIHLSTFITARSGAPFNIVLGKDLNGDAQFNDRPTFATDLSRPSVVLTRWGAFDTNPTSGQTTIPINYGQGPSQFLIYLSLGKSFNFGSELKPSAGASPPKPGTGKTKIDRRYTLDISVNADNVLNHVNLAPPVGTLNSPLFGRSTALSAGSSTSANRVINLQAWFHF